MGSQLPWSNAPPKDETKWPAGSEALHPTHAMNAHEFAIHKEKEKQRESLRQFQVTICENEAKRLHDYNDLSLVLQRERARHQETRDHFEEAIELQRDEHEARVSELRAELEKQDAKYKSLALKYSLLETELNACKATLARRDAEMAAKDQLMIQRRLQAAAQLAAARDAVDARVAEAVRQERLKTKPVARLRELLLKGISDGRHQVELLQLQQRLDAAERAREASEARAANLEEVLKDEQYRRRGFQLEANRLLMRHTTRARPTPSSRLPSPRALRLRLSLWSARDSATGGANKEVGDVGTTGDRGGSRENSRTS